MEWRLLRADREGQRSNRSALSNDQAHASKLLITSLDTSVPPWKRRLLLVMSPNRKGPPSTLSHRLSAAKAVRRPPDDDLYIKVQHTVCLSDRSDFKARRNYCAAQVERQRDFAARGGTISCAQPVRFRPTGPSLQSAPPLSSRLVGWTPVIAC